MTPWRSLLLAATLLATGVLTVARAQTTDSSASRVAAARVELDCLLRKREQSRADILAERQRVQAHLAQLAAFRAGLDPVRNAQSIGRADQAIARDRSALDAIAARLSEADRASAQLKRAIANLVLAPRQRSLGEELRRTANVSLSNALHCGLPASASPVADVPFRVRLIAHDLCGERIDAHFVGRDGLSTNATLADRLNRILSRLGAVGGEVPVRLLVGCPQEGRGSFSTSTTSFLGECALGPDRSDDEVAFLVAHEIAHVRMQHLSVTYVAHWWDRFRNGEAPEGVDVNTADPFVIATALAARLGDFGRDQEYEADLAAATAVMTAGFSPAGIGQFLDRAARNESSDEAARLAALSAPARARDAGNIAVRDARRIAATHPSSRERRRALEIVFGDNFWMRDPATGRCGP